MTNKVLAWTLPKESLLKNRIAPNDFLDCYKVSSSMPARQAANIIVDFPNWVRFLLLIRSIVVTLFGLMHAGPSAKDQVGSFPVELEKDEEVIAGYDDKHLEFRVSVISKSNTVYLATWVRPHNIGGRLYLSAIMPFHILIARNALARVASQELNKNRWFLICMVIFKV